LWLLADLFERLPEVGDLDRPKLAFFFDEAHLLFDDAPPALLTRVEQMVRLIRSKGVGVYFCTQSPADVPDTVLGQLGNRVQHALRAFTPKDQRAVKTAADTFRPNPKLDTARAISELAVGEALVSLLDESGTPGMVERAWVAPPRSRLGTITPAERAAIIAASPVAGKYDQAIDRVSAFEQLQGRSAAPAQPPATPAAPSTPAAARTVSWGTPNAQTASQPAPGAWPGAPSAQAPAPSAWPGAPNAPAPAPASSVPPSGRQPILNQPAGQPAAQPAQGGIASAIGAMLSGSGRRQGLGEAMAKSLGRGVAGQIGRDIGNQIFRGIFGTTRR
jgi:hypothetical protein